MSGGTLKAGRAGLLTCTCLVKTGLTYCLVISLPWLTTNPLSHPHCPVGQLRSRVVGPEYVGHIQGSQVVGSGRGMVGRGRGGGYYYSTLPAVSLSASLSPHLFLSSFS